MDDSNNNGAINSTEIKGKEGSADTAIVDVNEIADAVENLHMDKNDSAGDIPASAQSEDVADG